MHLTRRSALVLALAALAALAGGCARSSARASAARAQDGGAPASQPQAAAAPAIEPPGVTFFVTADTHVGDSFVADATPAMIDAMNRLPGTALPAPLVGRVAAPRGVLVAGDLTDRGTPPQWQAFVAAFGLTGREGRLRFPVFEGSGNHDLFGGRTVVPRGVARRHRGLVYALDWDDVHVVCLDRYPTVGHRRWLARDLARLRPGRPVVLYFHYPLRGPYSNPWREADKAALAGVIKPYRVVAIFHGHYHPERRYEWEGIPIFDVGSPYWDPTFAVVRATASHLEVASYDYVGQRFTEVFRGALPVTPIRPR
jgi:hypothetical protein